MSESEMIARSWTSRIRTSDEQQYGDYVRNTGIRDFARTPGNLGAQVLMRTLGDGTSEVTVLSWWDSIESIGAFAGADPQIARYYPEDDHFLLEKPIAVEHHRVVVNLSGEH